MAVQPEEVQLAFRLPLHLPEAWVTQANIEMVIGRLLTDEEFRGAFLTDPQAAINALIDQGARLTPAEIAALMATDRKLWEQVAERIDPRLQKASLKPWQ